jgi:hypothetical protein
VWRSRGTDRGCQRQSTRDDIISLIAFRYGLRAAAPHDLADVKQHAIEVLVPAEGQERDAQHAPALARMIERAVQKDPAAKQRTENHASGGGAAGAARGGAINPA